MNRGVGNQLWMAGPAGAGQIEHLAKTMVETTHPEVIWVEIPQHKVQVASHQCLAKIPQKNTKRSI